MSTLKTNNLEHLDASSPNITLGIGGGVNISGITTTETIRVGADNDGTNIYGNSQGIGIGIPTPTQELEVNGAIVARGQANAYSTDGLYIQNKGLGIFDISAWRDGASVSIITFSTDEGTDAAPVEQMRLTQTGNLGIGTNDPQRLLELAGSGGANNVELRLNAMDGGERQITFTGSGSNTHTIRSTGTTDNSLVFIQASDERMRINSSGNVGIGTTNPSNKLHIQRASSGMIRCTNPQDFGQSDISLIGSRNVNGECGSVRFLNHRQASDPNNDAEIFATVAGVSESSNVTGTNRGGNLAFSTRGTGDGDVLTERMRIGANGYLRLAGAGIQFNGDTADSNALDDYEEGTWTPVFAGSSTAGTYTYTTQTGNYTKIGNKVTAWCLLTDITTGSAGSGASIVNGLPFTAGGGNTHIGSLLLEEFDLTSTSIRGIHVVVANNANNAAFRVSRDGLADTNIQVTAKVNNNADIKFCVTYMVA